MISFHTSSMDLRGVSGKIMEPLEEGEDLDEEEEEPNVWFLGLGFVVLLSCSEHHIFLLWIERRYCRETGENQKSESVLSASMEKQALIWSFK